MSEIKSVTREGFNTIEQARADAAKFVKLGGKVAEGGKRADGRFGWTGEIRVDDRTQGVAGDFHCGRCAGTGQFITMNLNGKPHGPGGICFRCAGKGRHNAADRKRNLGYDMWEWNRAAREMAA